MSNEFYANGEKRAEIEAVQRLQVVKRWHMIDTTRQQTLAEHSANVALLCWYIAYTAPGGYFGPADGVASFALRHDLAEVFTGDIPTHTKKYLNGLGNLECSVLPRIFWSETPSSDQELLIKLCDLADGLRFVRLYGVDITAEHAAAGLFKQLEAKSQVATRWPEPVFEHVKDAVQFYAHSK